MFMRNIVVSARIQIIIDNHFALVRGNCGKSRSDINLIEGNFEPRQLRTTFEYLFNQSLVHTVFGCIYFVQDLSPGLDKLFARAIKCVFLGYSRLQKGYKCYSPSTRRYYMSADQMCLFVTFFEDTPFFFHPECSFNSLFLSSRYLKPKCQ